MKQHFRFSPDILSRLGEELIPNPEQGIVELVKNSYDADASKCIVELHKVAAPGGSIVVRDDGTGMDIEDISNGWLVVGKSQKEQGSERTPKFNRLPVGDKGLGRLAALRLGNKVTLKTVPETDSDNMYSVVVKWDAFEQAEVVEDVSFDVERTRSEGMQGTEIAVEDLGVSLNTYAVQRLARELILLADPFENRFGFSPQLVAEEFEQFQELVANSYFGEAEYHLSCVLDGKGRAQATLLDWKGNILFTADHTDLTEEDYAAPEARFDLWVFILDAQTFSTRKTSIGEVRNWLSAFGGVHLYHRGLRVRPYGDPGHDWLEMNLARARSPEERPSTNTSIGKIVVDDPEEVLIQKTDRLGFIEGQEFKDLRRFAIDAMNWMASRRMQLAEKRRAKKRKQTSTTTSKAKEDLERTVAKEIPETAQREVSKKIRNLERAVEREAQALREDLQLYRTLATAGTTSAVFAHETSKPVTVVSRAATQIETVGRAKLGDEYPRLLASPVQILRGAAEALKSFVNFPLHLLKRDKRRTGIVSVKQVVRDLLELFKPYFSESKITADLIVPEEDVNIVGSEALVESIVTNLITNSINAFNREDAKVEDRQLVVRATVSDTAVTLRVMDNGPGIVGISLEDIWLPGRTTTPGGTGFGLTIVKDSVSDLDGEVSAIAHGELGGAEFIVILPRTET